MGNSPFFFDADWLVRQIMGNPGNGIPFPGSNTGVVPQLVNSPVSGGGNQVQDTLTTLFGTETTDQAANGLLELAALHGSKLSQALEISTGTGSNAGYQQPSAIVKRPWIDPPDGSVPYDQHGKVALPNVGSVATVLTMTVPDGYDGVINYYSWNFVGGGFTQASGDIVVQILRNNAPIRNYDNIQVEAGTVGNARPVSPIRVYSGQIISITVNHANNALLNGDVVGSLVGYFYPSMS